MNKQAPQQGGFILITAVIVLSAVLILIAQSVSTGGYGQGNGMLDLEFKELSYFVALSCIDRAMYSLSQDLDYVGNETLTVDAYQCTILPLTYEGTNTVIRSSATAERSTTKLKLIVDTYLVPISFQEE